MTVTRFAIEITTPAPLLPDQHRQVVNLVAQQLKKLEVGDRPLGNCIQRAFVIEEKN